MIQELLILLDATLFNVTGLLFVVLGVFLLIRVSGFPDLTVDGSFTMGAAVYSVLLSSGFGTIYAIAGAFVFGSIGGCLTWIINQKLGVGKVVSGVLSMIILILSAPYLAGSTTRSLLNAGGFHQELNRYDVALSSWVLTDTGYQLHFCFYIFLFVIFALAVSLLLKFHRFFSSPNLIRPGYPSSWHEKWIFTFCAKLSRENIKIQFIKQ